VGQHALLGYYSGAAGFPAGESGYLTQTVYPATTATTIASSENPATVGDSITFTAHVTGATGTSLPTGTVTFNDYGTVLGTATLNGSGVATLTTAALAGGVSHQIDAVYNGNNIYAGSASAYLSQTVNLHTAVMGPLVPSANPAVTGQSVTYTGTINVPNATISFTAGSLAEGTVTANASGQFSITFVPPTGIYGVYATFYGNATYSSAVAEVNQTVE
jgi:hypothetical protein